MLIFMKFLSLPGTRGIDIDSPEAVAVHREIILRKPFLRKHYEEMYAFFRQQAAELSAVEGLCLELGSGGGFLKTILPDIVTSDIFPYPHIDRVIQAGSLPFAPGELKGIFMLNVLHHLPSPSDFFREADRCLSRGGRVAMIEPFNSLFGRFLYKRFHHEPFDETAPGWNLQAGGRLSTSNQALPWIIFWRDRGRFERMFPNLRVRSIFRHSVLCYPLSGGLSLRGLAPSWSYPLLSALDRRLSRIGPGLFPIFQTIILEKI